MSSWQAGLGALPGRSARQNTGFWIYDFENHRKNTGFCVGHFAKTRLLPAFSLAKKEAGFGGYDRSLGGGAGLAPRGVPPRARAKVVDFYEERSTGAGCCVWVGTAGIDASAKKLFFGVNMFQICEFIEFCEGVKHRFAEYLVNTQCFGTMILHDFDRTLVFHSQFWSQFWPIRVLLDQNQCVAVVKTEISNLACHGST